MTVVHLLIVCLLLVLFVCSKCSKSSESGNLTLTSSSNFVKNDSRAKRLALRLSWKEKRSSNKHSRSMQRIKQQQASMQLRDRLRREVLAPLVAPIQLPPPPPPPPPPVQARDTTVVLGKPPPNQLSAVEARKLRRNTAAAQSSSLLHRLFEESTLGERFVLLKGKYMSKEGKHVSVRSYVAGAPLVASVALLEELEQSCLDVACVALTVERNRWVVHYAYLQEDWIVNQPSSDMLVLKKYWGPKSEPQPKIKYGCSRHKHACTRIGDPLPPPGTAPCCAHLMADVINAYAKALRKHGVKMMINQGGLLNLVRDGTMSLFDHDFDPSFTVPEQQAYSILQQELPISNQFVKFREKDWHFTLERAKLLQTNWSDYVVCGGDFDWNNACYRNPKALQMTFFFTDHVVSGLTHFSPNDAFRCFDEFDVLLPRDWPESVPRRFGSKWYDRLHTAPEAQWTSYGAYANWTRRDTHGLVYNADMTLRTHEQMQQAIQDCLQRYPDYWK